MGTDRLGCTRVGERLRAGQRGSISLDTRDEIAAESQAHAREQEKSLQRASPITRDP